MKYLFDASAALAVILDEPGGDRAADMLAESTISAVNLSEVVSKLLKLSIAPADVSGVVAALSMSVLAVEERDGLAAGLMTQASKPYGLSLGDRICLAMARRLDLIAVTADRSWAAAAPALDAKVELIR